MIPKLKILVEGKKVKEANIKETSPIDNIEPDVSDNTLEVLIEDDDTIKIQILDDKNAIKGSIWVEIDDIYDLIDILIDAVEEIENDI